MFGITNMDTLSGRLEFTPTIVGSYVIAYDVEEYRNGDLIAVTHRVVKIVVLNTGSSALPTGGINSVSGGTAMGDTIMVCVNTPLNFDYVVTDPDAGDSVAILHNLAAELPGATFSSTGSNPLTFNIQWTPLTSGIYQLGLVIQNLGCPAPSSSQVADLTIFVMDDNDQLTVSDFYLCSTDTIDVIAPSGYLSYLWNTGDTTQSIEVTTAGVYAVTTTGGNCGSNNMAVEIYDSPPFDIGMDTTIYLGDSIQLTALLGNGLTPGLYVDTIVNTNLSPNGVATIPLNVQNVFPAVITTDVLDFITLDVTNPPSTNNLELYLVAPNTAMIPLAIRRGGTTNTAYQNTTFDPDVTDLITNYNTPAALIPADSSFVPEGTWSHFDGSWVNGTWELAMRQVGGSQNGTATYFGMQFGGAFDYQWSPADGLSCTDCPNPWVAPDSTTTYVLETSNAFGCTTFDTITITVVQEWDIDTLEFDVFADSTQSFCLTIEPNFGTPAYDSVLTAPFYGTIANNGAGFGCFDYQAGSIAGGTDSLWIVTCDASGFCDSNLVILNIIAPTWTNDTLEYVIAEDSLLQICATLPTGFGTLATDTLENLVHGTVTTAGTACYDYLANSNSEFSDTLLLIACNTQGFCDTTVVIVHTVSCVWAGDADDNMVVDNYDILPIGLGYNLIGDPRPNAGIDFDCEPHFNWNQATPVSNVDYKHADTDGDGIIEMDDTMAIVQNWGMIHMRTTPNDQGTQASASNTPFLVNYAAAQAGATVRLPILLGSQTNPVDSAYGLAYTIYYDQSMVDTNSVTVDFDTSWLGTEHVDMATIHKNFFDYGQIQIGMTRIDHQPVSGYGQIGTLQFTIKDDIIRNPMNLHLIMGIGQVRFIDEMENELAIEGQPSYVVIMRSEDPTATTNLAPQAIRLYPNPAQTWVQVESTEEPIERIRLFNSAGQLLRSYQPQNTAYTLHLEDLSSGIYQVEVQTAGGVEHQQLVKQ